MERELLSAAKEGSVETLLKLLHQDELILRRYISGGFRETPLHVAAMFGHLEFTKSVLSHMPEMAKQLDYRKSTPLHVATANGHILVVKKLLSVNPELCFAKDWEGRNPVHMAVIKGHIDILKEMVRFRPHAAQALCGASTILHLCVKHYQVEALEYIILEAFRNDAELVNFKDEEGFTILHRAVAEKQIETVKFLLQHGKVDVKAINAYGFTALDISLAHGRKNIRDIEVTECFQQAGKLGAKSTTRSNFHSEDIICNDPSANVVANSNSNETRLTTAPSKNIKKSIALETKREKKRRLENSCNTMMIVASLIATVTFQALINPPKGYNTGNYASSDAFMFFNTASFSVSIGIILLLISGLPLKRRLLIWLLRIIMWIAVLSSALTYFLALSIVIDFGVVFYTTEDRELWQYPPWTILVAMGLFIIILILGNAIRILFKVARCFRRWIKKRRGREDLNAQDRSCV